MEKRILPPSETAIQLDEAWKAQIPSLDGCRMALHRQESLYHSVHLELFKDVFLQLHKRCSASVASERPIQFRNQAVIVGSAQASMFRTKSFLLAVILFGYCVAVRSWPAQTSCLPNSSRSQGLSLFDASTVVRRESANVRLHMIGQSHSSSNGSASITTEVGSNPEIFHIPNSRLILELQPRGGVSEQNIEAILLTADSWVKRKISIFGPDHETGEAIWQLRTREYPYTRLIV